MKFRMVEELAFERQDVNQCCKTLGVSRGGYYAWLNRPLSRRETDNQVLAQKIKELWEKSRKTYGLPRLKQELKKEKIICNKKRLSKLMKEQNIQGVGKRKFKVITTDSKHPYPIAERVFKTEEVKTQVTKVNQYWGGDITYVPTGEGWLYLSVFMDLFTRKVVGHSMKETLHTELVLEALEMGLKHQGIIPNKDLVAHSDRGSQYASSDYTKKLNESGIIISHSRKGNCYDNAFVESFFKTLKVELVYQRKFKTREEAKKAIFEYIEVWYNRQRIHSSIEFMSPVEYENKLNQAA